MPRLLYNGKRFCHHTVSDQTGLKYPTATIILRFYRDNGWVDNPSRIADRPKKSTYDAHDTLHDAYAFNRSFWRVVADTNSELLTRLNTDDTELYNDVIEARQMLPPGTEAEPKHQALAQRYLGGIAVLALRVDPELRGAWMGGSEGWGALASAIAFERPTTTA